MASGKVARVERIKAPVAAPAPAQPPPREKELSDDQVYLQQLARAQDDFEKKRGIIAESCGLIIEDPQQHFNRLPQVVALINDPDLKIAKLAIASLALLFKDIVPGYKIREITKQERETAVSKAVKSVRAFEGCLLHNYQRFLQCVETIARGNVHNKASNKQKLGLRVTCARALCSLLEPLCHFNFAANLCKAVVSKLTSPHADIANACRECIASFFASNRSLDIILAAVKQIAEGIKSHMHDVSPELLQVLLQLKLVKSCVASASHKSSRPALDDDDDLDALKLKQDLAEAESALDPKEEERINTEIVDCVFQCFFRLLKANPPNLHVLPVVLRGISKYAHLISIDFVSDIVAVVRKLATASSTPPQLQIACVSCVTSVLRNQGSAWSVDLKDFTTALYSTLFHSVVRSGPSDAAVDNHNPQETREQIAGLLTTLKSVLIDNRQLSLSRVDAFIKRCLLTATHAPQHITLAVLAFSHALVLKYPKSSHLFSSESGE
jgi:nucleolar complex protein 3